MAWDEKLAGRGEGEGLGLSAFLVPLAQDAPDVAPINEDDESFERVITGVSRCTGAARYRSRIHS